MSTLDQYLKIVGLEQYQSIMIDNGYDDPELIAELTEDDLVAIGVKKGHAKRAFLKSKELANKSTQTHTHEASPDTSSSSSAPQQPPAKERTTTISIGKKGTEDEEDSGDEKDDKQSGVALQSRILHEGFIQKKGNEGFFGSKMFQKRYFKIYEEGRLAYYKSNHDASPINIIEMRGALSIDDMEGKNTGFKLSMKTSARVYWLVCQKLDEKQKWVQVLKSQITPPVVPKPVDPNEIKPYLQHREEPSQCASTRFDSPLSWDVIEKQIQEGMIRLHIHSNGQLYVEEVRSIELDENNKVLIKDLPKEIDERSVHFQSLSEPTAFVMEQTYYNDEKTQEVMLEKLIGKEIEVSVPRDDRFDEPVVFRGELIYNPKESTYALQNKENNTVHFLKTNEAISYNLLENQVEPIFRESQLDWVVSGNEKKQLIKLSYNSEKLFKWHANYVAILNPKETEMEFRGWFTIENESGKTFNNSNVILIREPEEKKKEEKKDEDSSPLPVALPKLGGFKLGSLPGLGGNSDSTPAEPEKRIYRYEIPHKTTLKNNEEKQICFVSTKLPIKSFDFITFDTPKYTKYTNTNKDHGANAKANVNSSVQFTWNLPYSIPAGQMKCQRQLKDKFGSDIVSTFEIEHFNQTDIVTLPLQPLGKVSATRTQTGYNFDLNNLYIVETFEIRVNNGREEPVRITVEESLYRWEHFEITSSTLTDSDGTINFKFNNHPTHPRRIQWVLTIPPLDGKVIKYSVFYSGLNLPQSMMPKNK